MWFLLAAILLVGCGGSSDDDSDAAEVVPVTVVAVETVARGSVADRLTTTSVVEAERSADVVPLSPGLVLSVHADDGDRVRRGDLLAVLESVSLSAGAERSRAEVGRLERRVAEMRALTARGAVSARELEDLEYQLQSARTTASEASRSFGQTRLTAPFDGVVARRDVKVGEIASQRAFQIVDLAETKVVVDLPERDVGRVAVGQPVRLESAYDEELQGRGRVVRVAPVIDASTGTFRVTVAVEDGQQLRPGQFVNVHLEVDRHDDVLVVPRRALIWEDGKPVVFAMVPAPPPEPGAVVPEDASPGHVAARTVIQIGLVDEDGVEVTSGLDEGAQVVVIGQSNLKDGARVRASEGIRVEAVESAPVPPGEAG
jgi:membrane fusion protein (multidrug efflux system)